MLGKAWEVALLTIVVCLAAKLVISILEPLLPALVGLVLVFSIAGTVYHKKRKW